MKALTKAMVLKIKRKGKKAFTIKGGLGAIFRKFTITP